MKIIFAFALSNNHAFEKKHFGEAENFGLYIFQNGKLTFGDVVINPYRDTDEEGIHGSAKKGNAIIELLKNKGVSILVSRQFGKNIKRVNQHFIPVIISEEKPGDVIPVLEKHISWLQEEKENKIADFMLFRIKNGIMKTQISQLS